MQKKQKSNKMDGTPPPTISVDREVDKFIRATAEHYGRDFQTVLDVVLRAGMRTVINAMMGAQELDELSRSKLILEPFKAGRIIQP